jgi:glutamate-1-semialdehyde 2,1-aminomutase
MATILEEYRQKHPGSARRYEEARGHFPGGVTHDNRYTTPFPIYVTHGQGPLKWDVDGNEYVDYVSGHGALILGHSHPEIVSAVSNQVARGTHLGANTEEETRWARAIKRLMPSVEKVRFHSSGTESTLMALRLARAYTGKDKVIKFEEHFHGWHDYVVSAADRAIPGVPVTTADSMIVLPPDIDAVERAMSGDDDIAAVILEPTGAHYGQLPLMVPQFLKDLRELTRRHGVLLIMDEVVTGFRVAPGGAQGLFGIDPDLTTMAKIVAGGLPGGVVGGRSDIVDMIAFRDDPDWDSQSRVAHPGTFNANPLSAAAGATCLEMIADQPINERADAMAGRLKRGLNDVFARMEVAGHAHGMASLIHLTLKECDCDREICTMSHQDIKAAGSAAKTVPLKRAMINAGVDMMGRGSLIVSATHSEGDVDRTLSAFEEALSAMRAEGVV